MQVFIVRKGALYGQWSDDQVHGLYRSGDLLPTDLYWVDGMPAWRTLASADVPAAAKVEAVPPPPLEPLKETVRLVPHESISAFLPRVETASPPAPTPAPPPAAKPRIVSRPPAPPVIKPPAPVTPKTYVYSKPAARILQLLSPEDIAERKRRASLPETKVPQAAWLIPPGRSRPFGVVSDPSLIAQNQPQASVLPPPALPSVQPPAMVPSSAKPANETAPAGSKASSKINRPRQSPFRGDWMIPGGVAVVLGLLIGWAVLAPANAHRLNGHAQLFLVFVAVLLGVSFALGPRSRAAVRFLVITLATLLLMASHRDIGRTGRSPSEPEAAGLNGSTPAQQAMNQLRTSKTGNVMFDPVSTDKEVTRLKGLAQDQSGPQRRVMETSAEILQKLSRRLKACQEAERSLLDLGLNPSDFTSPVALDARRAALISCQPPVHDVTDYLTNLETSARTALALKNVGAADADAFVADLNNLGKRPALVSYWQKEGAILDDLLANLDLLKANWGKWRTDNKGKLTFDEPAPGKEYATNETKLQEDLALQKSAQDDALDAAIGQ